jgi:hypothetical protein
MSDNGIPRELRQRLPHEPDLWARNFLSHPNAPTRSYDFYTGDGPEDGDFLWYLVDEDGPMNPENWGDINILLFGRGCLKTWTCTTIAGWATDCYPTIEGVATAPVDDQRYEVVERFKDKVEQSGLDGRRVKDALSHQKFRNYVERDDGSQTVAYSSLKSRSAWGDGDKLRGLHTHYGIVDEAQDTDEGMFSTMLEAIDREIPQVEYFPTTFVIGTPKMANTFFHKLWKMSDQQTWDADADTDHEKRDSGKWLQQSEPDEFLPEALQKEQAELEDKLEQLKATDADESVIADVQQKLDEIEGFSVRGWHIDQHNSPLHSDTDIAFKQETYSEKKFKNEVEAKFYTPENDLITNDDVFDAFDAELRFQPTRSWDDSTVYLTVDWGGGKGEGAASTVVTVGEELPDDETIYIRKIELLDSDLSHSEERDRIDEYMQQYNVDLGVVDEGYGDTTREQLQDEYGYGATSDNPIYGCWFGNVKDKEEIKWNRFNDEKRFFTASKTYAVKKMAEDFKNGNFVLPKHGVGFDTKSSKGTQILDQLTAPYTERRETQTGRTKMTIASDRNDDIFDTFTYLWIASRMVEGTRRTLRTAGSNMRAGY